MSFMIFLNSTFFIKKNNGQCWYSVGRRGRVKHARKRINNNRIGKNRNKFAKLNCSVPKGGSEKEIS